MIVRKLFQNYSPHRIIRQHERYRELQRKGTGKDRKNLRIELLPTVNLDNLCQILQRERNDLGVAFSSFVKFAQYRSKPLWKRQKVLHIGVEEEERGGEVLERSRRKNVSRRESICIVNHLQGNIWAVNVFWRFVIV